MLKKWIGFSGDECSIPCSPGIKKGLGCVLDSRMKNLSSFGLEKPIRQKS